MAEIWPLRRGRELVEKVQRAFAKPVLRYTVCPSDSASFLQYFSPEALLEIGTLDNEYLKFQPIHSGFEDVDLLITTCHGEDLSENLWLLRSMLGPDALIAAWAWDNHLAPYNNLKTAEACDFVFPSHAYCADSIANPASCLGPHIPACSVQWSAKEAQQYLGKENPPLRSGSLLANYVNYPFSWRASLLETLREEAPEIDVRLMPPNDRSRYFGQTRRDRFRDWLGSKATLILPIDQDLSTRVFDALLAGLVLVIPPMIADFDRVIPPGEQSDLGVIRIADCEIATIREAAGQAERLFDSLGEKGVMRRHEYVRQNHLLRHRIGSILHALRFLAQGEATIEFAGALHLQFSPSPALEPHQ